MNARPSTASTSPGVTAESTVSAHSQSIRWSSAGMPSTSQMMVVGIGIAKSSTRSAGAPAASMPSSSSSASSAARIRSRSTRRALNSLATSERSRVCSGGSVENRPAPVRDTGRIRGWSSPIAAARLNLGSASTARTSSYRVASQAPSPYGIRIRTSGWSRNSA